MATRMIALRVQARSVLGKQVKTLRGQGVTPLHLYGRNAPSLALEAETASVRRTLTQAGRSQPVSLEVEGHDPFITFVRDIQFHPLDNSVLHVDFLAVDASVKLEVEVPILLEGEAPAVHILGGRLVQAMSAVRVQVSPLEVPQNIVAVVSDLDDFSKTVRVSDLQAPASVVILSDSEQMVARVVAPVAAETPSEAAPEAETPTQHGEETTGS